METNSLLESALGKELYHPMMSMLQGYGGWLYIYIYREREMSNLLPVTHLVR